MRNGKPIEPSATVHSVGVILITGLQQNVAQSLVATLSLAISSRVVDCGRFLEDLKHLVDSTHDVAQEVVVAHEIMLLYKKTTTQVACM